MRIRVIARYRARDLTYEVGEVLDLPDGVALALLNDSPGSFAPWEPDPSPAVGEAPPADTMVRRPPRRKG